MLLPCLCSYSVPTPTSVQLLPPSLLISCLCSYSFPCSKPCLCSYPVPAPTSVQLLPLSLLLLCLCSYSFPCFYTVPAPTSVPHPTLSLLLPLSLPLPLSLLLTLSLLLYLFLQKPLFLLLPLSLLLTLSLLIPQFLSSSYPCPCTYPYSFPCSYPCPRQHDLVQQQEPERYTRLIKLLVHAKTPDLSLYLLALSHLLSLVSTLFYTLRSRFFISTMVSVASSFWIRSICPLISYLQELEREKHLISEQWIHSSLLVNKKREWKLRPILFLDPEKRISRL